MITIYPYDPLHDLAAAHSVWQAAFGMHYPLTEFLLQSVTANPVRGQGGGHFVAGVDGRNVGFIATQINQTGDNPLTGYILGIAVHPDYQRCGIGRKLLITALKFLIDEGCKNIMSGGKYPRIFPGIPSDLPNAQAFFEKQGWTLDQTDYDVYRDLTDYETPASITARIEAEGVRLYAGSEADAAEVLAFNDREFAGWAQTYHYVASLGDYQDFLVARDPVHGVIGTLLMFSPQSRRVRCDALWRTLWGESAGGLGEVGIGVDHRKRGMGLALVAVGSEILRARGVGHCNIGFTSLVDFYGKLGYQVWREYRIGWKRY